MSSKEFFVAFRKQWNHDAMGDAAGNLTFSGVLALFPFLIFLVAVTGRLITPEALERVVTSVRKLAPAAVTDLIITRLNDMQQGAHVGLITGSALLGIWSASSGVTALMRALNVAYSVVETRSFWKVRGIAVLTTLVGALLACFAAGVAIVIPAVDHYLGPVATLLVWLRLPIAGLLMMLLWAVLYYWLPNVEQQFRFISVGSIVGVTVWLLASWGFSLYVTHFGSYNAMYGALGGVVVLLIWMWISSQVLLLGAEINAVLERKSEPEAPQPKTNRGLAAEEPKFASKLWLAAGFVSFFLISRRRS